MKCKIKKQWLDMEKEHTNNVSEQKKIARDHIKEFGCSYYPELKKLEKKLKKNL